MLLCCLPDPLLRMPGSRDSENGENLKVGGDKPGQDSWDLHTALGSNLLLVSPLAQETPKKGSIWCLRLRFTWCLGTQQAVHCKAIIS